MRTGGVSTSGLSSHALIMREHLTILKKMVYIQMYYFLCYDTSTKSMKLYILRFFIN